MLPTRINRSGSPFEALFQEMGRSLSPVLMEEENKGILGHYPVDVHEDDNNLYVDAEMPGFDKGDVKVTIDQGILSLQAERTVEEKQGAKHLNERRYSRISRSFTLPTEVDAGTVNARLENGVLHITLAKKKEAQPHQIEIN